jgi:hypothetical protein
MAERILTTLGTDQQKINIHPHWLHAPLVSAYHLSEIFLLMWKLTIYGGLSFCILNSHLNLLLPIGVLSEKI